MNIYLRLVLLLSFTIFLLANSNGQSRFKTQIATSTLIDFDNSRADCTAALYNDSTAIYLVSARHNFYRYNKSSNSYQLKHDSCSLIQFGYLKDSLLEQNTLRIDLRGLEKAGDIFYSNEKDIMAAKISSSITYREKDDSLYIKSPYTFGYSQYVTPKGIISGHSVIYLPKDIIPFQDLNVGEDIYIFGYPRSIGSKTYTQYDIDQPLLRKGVIAGINRSKKSVILDAQVFKGNSGAPIISIAHPGKQLLGIVIEKILVTPNGSYTGNSGYAIAEPISTLLELLKENE